MFGGCTKCAPKAALDEIGLEALRELSYPTSRLPIVTPKGPRHLMLDEPDAAAERALRALPDAEERARVLAALEACGGDQTRAAKALGISRGTLIARLERYEAPRPTKR